MQSAAEEKSLDRMVEQTFPASDPLPSPVSIGGADAEHSEGSHARS
jgi:hypothetical protein